MAFEIQAHRGSRAFFPENSIEAFCKAADSGVRVIELDLVVSCDHQLVVSHDPWISGPLCTAPGGTPLAPEDRDRYLIYTMDYAEIAAFGCGLPDPGFPDQQRTTACKPLLTDVFREVDAYMRARNLQGTMIFNIELKSWPERDRILHPEPELYAFLVVGQLRLCGMFPRVRLQSFDFRLVEEVRKLCPEIAIGILADDLARIHDFMERMPFLPAYVNPYYLLMGDELVAQLHRKGIRVIPWTVNLPEEMLAMKRMGADGIITDYPELALRLDGLFA